MGEEPERIYDVKRFLQLAKRYSDIQELDAITVNKLLEKIRIAIDSDTFDELYKQYITVLDTRI